MTNRCEFCGSPCKQPHHTYCCVACGIRGSRGSKRKDPYRMVKTHRCGVCGRKINTAECFCCAMERREKEAKDHKRFVQETIEHARRSVQEDRSGESVDAEGVTSKPKAVRGGLHHPDIIQGDNTRDGVRDNGAQNRAATKRGRKHHRDDS